MNKARQLEKAIDAQDLALIKSLIAEQPQLLKQILPTTTYPILYAAEKGFVPVLKLMVEQQPDLVNFVDKFNQNALIFAAAAGQIESVTYLLEQGASAEFATSNASGYTPLHWSLNNGFEAVGILLINHLGTALNMMTGTEDHPIHLAARSGCHDALKLILQHQPDALNLCGSLQQTALIWAAARGHISCINFLLDSSADPKPLTIRPGKDGHGLSAFHWAIKNGHIEAVNLFLQKCPEMETITATLPPLHVAAQFGHIDIMRLLLDKNEQQITHTDENGRTALHEAAKSGQKDACYLLLERCPELLEIPCSSGKTAFIEAVLNDQPELVAFLLIRNARIDYPSFNALELAKQHELYDIMNLIILAQLKDTPASELPQKISEHIKSGLQALYLIKQRPDLAESLLKSQRISNLLKFSDSFCQRPNSKSDIRWYHPNRTSRRRGSNYNIFDFKTGQTEEFRESGMQGSKGKYGLVIFFKSSSGNTVTVKSPVPKEWERTYRHVKMCIEREATMAHRAYPEATYTQPFIFSFLKQVSGKGTVNDFSYRFIQPYVDGETAHKSLDESRDVRQVAEIILNIAEELHMLHGRKVIHADPSMVNVIVNSQTKKARFIDFGLSLFQGKNARQWVSKPEKSFLPHELRADHSHVPAHPAQDVYMLGDHLMYTLSKSPIYENLCADFPAIKEFLDKSQEPKPMNRQSLPEFCQALRRQLDSGSSLVSSSC